MRPLAVLGFVPVLTLACSGVPVREPAPAPPPSAATQTPAPAAPAPPATSPGLEIVRNDCLTCHSEDLLRQQRLTRAQWAKTIEKMHTWGAPTEPENVETLTAYLASTYGLDAAPFVPQTLGTDEAAALFGPPSDGALAGGDRERGLALYGDQCSACHEEGGRGGPDGVALAGRRILDLPADFLSVLRTGRGRMPDYSGMTDAEAADLLAYLRSAR